MGALVPMRRMKCRGALATAGVALCVLLAGCAGNGAASPEAQRTMVSTDNFQPYTEVSTVALRQGRPPEVMMLKLHARRDRATGTTTMHARVHIGYLATSARRYNSASNDRARPLAITLQSKMYPSCSQRDGCIYGEEYLIDIPEAELRAARATGYRFKLLSRSTAEKLVAVPPTLISTLLASLDGKSGGRSAGQSAGPNPALAVAAGPARAAASR